MAGIARVEVKHGIEWSVQTVSGQRAVKDYTCPGCSGTLAAGVAHVVVWRHDSIMGEASAIAERRHWHQRCWRAA